MTWKRLQRAAPFLHHVFPFHGPFLCACSRTASSGDVHAYKYMKCICRDAWNSSFSFYKSLICVNFLWLFRAIKRGWTDDQPEHCGTKWKGRVQEKGEITNKLKEIACLKSHEFVGGKSFRPRTIHLSSNNHCRLAGASNSSWWKVKEHCRRFLPPSSFNICMVRVNQLLMLSKIDNLARQLTPLWERCLQDKTCAITPHSTVRKQLDQEL